jgi:hypothetical protein
VIVSSACGDAEEVRVGSVGGDGMANESRSRNRPNKWFVDRWRDADESDKCSRKARGMFNGFWSRMMTFCNIAFRTVGEVAGVFACAAHSTALKYRIGLYISE